MIVDCISDLHGFFPHLEGGDLLIVAGDLTARDVFVEYMEIFHWMGQQKYKKKIFIGGNHDNWLQDHRPIIIETAPNTYYLYDSGVEFDGLKIWGSPWSRKFPGMNPQCMAFTVDHDDELMEKWRMIPDDTDILITHTPPFLRHDAIVDEKNECIRNVGSPSLNRWVMSHKDTLKLHVCGHIHEDRGFNDWETPYSCNASIMDRLYRPVHRPIRVVIDKEVSFRLNDQDDL
jgi:Icc-related predicted phosphoesterase